MSNQATQVTQWHTLTSEAAAQQLEVNPEQGLGSADSTAIGRYNSRTITRRLSTKRRRRLTKLGSLLANGHFRTISDK
jgi:hypothetical protein